MLARHARLLLEREAAARERRRVHGVAAGIAIGLVDRLLHGGDTPLERMRGLVRDAVIVLDDVDTGEGEGPRELRQVFDARSLRLERRARERPGRDTGHDADA